MIRPSRRSLLSALPRLAQPPRRSASAPLRLRFVYTDLGAPTRYRVQHHIEQAQIAGHEAEAIPLDNLERLYDLTRCDLLYIHRLPLVSTTLPLLLAARLHRLPVLFDSDDLVWDPREREYNFLDAHYDARTVARLETQTRRTRLLMRLASAFVFSTNYLADRARQDFRHAAFVHPNALSRELVARSNEAYRRARERSPNTAVIIGYFSGQAHVHDEDMAEIAQALAAVLDQRPEARLRIYGGLTLRGPLAGPEYAARIERHPAVDWRELPEHIAQVDINIAPLVDNPQRRGKSAVKYYEAAAVGVPTVASRLNPYWDDIQHGGTGMLAGSHDEWVHMLTRLVGSPEMRRRLGDAARAQVLAKSTTDALAPRFAALVARACGRQMV